MLSRAAEQAVPAPSPSPTPLQDEQLQGSRSAPPCWRGKRSDFLSLIHSNSPLSPQSLSSTSFSGSYPKCSLVSLFSMILLLFQTHYQTTIAADSFSTFVSRCYSKPKAHAEAEAVPGCNFSMKHIASGVDLPPATGNALKVRVKSQYQPIRYFSSEIKLPIQGQKRDTRQTFSVSG